MRTPERDKQLTPLSTFGIGGTAEYFLTVDNEAELLQALSWAGENSVPYRVIGKATNIVFPARLPGLLIRMEGSDVQETGKRTLFASAGTLLQTLVNAANERGFAGLHTLAGIPGTVGGAIVGNAGAYGKEVSDHLEAVAVLDGVERRTLKKSECGFSYRESRFKREPFIVVGAYFRFDKGKMEDLTAEGEGIKQERAKKYPAGLKCPGSFFKNIPVQNVPKELLKNIDQTRIKGDKIPAGYLIEAVGAKGFSLGDVYVSDWHGNLIVNKGFGTAEHVRELADEIRKRVRDAFGIVLEEEVRYL